MPRLLSSPRWPGCSLLRPPEVKQSRCLQSFLTGVVTDTARHLVLICLLLLLSLSSSSSSQDDPQLRPPAGPFTVLGPPAGPYSPPAGPYSPPAGPYTQLGPPAGPYSPPAGSYSPPAGPYTGLEGAHAGHVPRHGPAQGARPPQTPHSSDSDDRSILSTPSSPQCLHENSCNASSAKSAAETICSLGPGLRARAALSSSLCWPSSGCPPPVLTAARLQALRSGGRECRAAAAAVVEQVASSNRAVEDALLVLASAWGEPGGGVCRAGQRDCPDCTEWYHTWLCLSLWPLYPSSSPGGPPQHSPLTPCPSQCSQVQTHCPFNIIEEDASMAGGDPTFLCQDHMMSASVRSPPSPSPPCCFEVLAPSQGGANSLPAPPQGGYVDLNATCSHLSSSLGGAGHTEGVACDAPAAPLTMANRTLFLRSERPGEWRSSEGVGAWGALPRSSEGSRPQGGVVQAVAAWTLSYKLLTL